MGHRFTQEGGAPSHPASLLIGDASPALRLENGCGEPALCVNEHSTDNDFIVLYSSLRSHRKGVGDTRSTQRARGTNLGH